MGDSEATVAGPRILGRYAVYEPIASGGMATVHYGRLLGPLGFSRTVAIKRLHPQHAQDPDFVTMFLDEARMAARVQHPNVVSTVDIVATDDEILLVMDYIHGEPLGQVMRGMEERGEKVPPPIALRIATDALQGLHAAHEATDESGAPLNLIHRDISPHNILLGADGIARVVDFGVAKAAGRASATRDGHIKGKLCYMAPEQLQGKAITRQADIHAFAIVLWEMLAGQRLFDGESETDVVAAVVKHEVPSLVRFVPGIAPTLDAVVRRGAAASLTTRYESARDMCLALERGGPIASTMAVADWLETRLKPVLAERRKILSVIERDERPDASDPAGRDSRAATKAWVARLSSPGMAAVTARVPAPSGSASAPAPAPAAAPPLKIPSGADMRAVVAAPLVESSRAETPAAQPALGAFAEAVGTTVDEFTGEVAARPSMPPDGVTGLPRAPSRRAVWTGGVACLTLLVGVIAVWGLGPAHAPPLPAAPQPSVAKPMQAVVPVPVPVDTAATSDVAAAASSSPPPAAPLSRSTSSVGRKPKPSCDPPFTIDELGVKVPKRECF